MAKVPFSKLQATLNMSEKEVNYLNPKTGENIIFNVKYYLPIKEKLDLVANIINNSLIINLESESE